MKKAPGRNISSQEIVIACTVDAGFAAPLAVALYSAARSTNRSLRVFVVGVEVPRDHRDRIERVCSQAAIEMTWIDASDSPHHTFHSPQVRSRYLRLSLPSLLPSDVDRVIYIDADTLVLSDLSPLFGSDIAGKALLAVRDYRIPFVAAPLGLKNHRDLKISADAPYFNSGVMLMSLEVWRRRDIEKRTLNYCVKMWPSMTLHDQEALNAVLHDEWSELDLGWNQQSVLFRPQAIPESDFKRMCLGRAANLRANPAIVHFTGGSKPWGYRCSHPFRRAWHTAFRNSGWFSDTLEYMRWYGPFLTSDLSRRAWSRARRLSPLSRFSQALSAAKRNT